MTQTYSDARGHVIRLGPELGRGGEGVVYELADHAASVTKIYSKPISVSDLEKLDALVTMASPELLALCAWPTAVLYESTGKKPVGFVMPRVAQAAALDSLINPGQRLRDFPKADWRFIVHAARNLADAVAELHRRGVVIGDLNESNVRVLPDARVRLIDCDSFQIRVGTRVFRSRVGTLLYYPPELQGTNAGAIERTPNHDAFSLAVLIFRLLFLGRHPYAGKYVGRGDQPGIPDLIAQHRFAFGVQASKRHIAPPPDALRLERLPRTMGALFESAFAESSVADSRPSALEWLQALGALEKDLVRCKLVATHYFPGEAGSCPWCEIEQSAGTTLFFTPLVAAGAPSDGRALTQSEDVEALWRAIANVPVPSSLEQLLPTPPILAKLDARLCPASGTVAARKLMTPLAVLSIAIMSLAIVNRSALLLGVAGGGGALLLLLWLAPIADRMMRRLRVPEVHKARTNLKRGLAAAKAELEHSCGIFDGIRRKVSVKYSESQGLRGEFEQELDALRAQSKAVQLQAYLSRCLLRSARLRGVGPQLVRALESYGVGSALDVEYNRVLYVRGIGPQRAAVLVAWKNQCVASFRFDPYHGVDAGKLAALQRRYIARYQTIATALAVGRRDLLNAYQTVVTIAADRRALLDGVAADAARVLQ